MSNAQTEDPRPADVNPLQTLLHAAYNTKSMQAPATRSELIELCESGYDQDLGRESVRNMAPGDAELTAPYKILRLALSGREPTSTSEEESLAQLVDFLIELAVTAMSLHPVFQHRIADLRSTQKVSDLTVSLVHRSATNIPPERLNATPKSFTKIRRRNLIRNSVWSFALLRFLQEQWDFERVIDEVRGGYWDLLNENTETSAQQLQSLSLGADQSTIAILSRHFGCLAERDRQRNEEVAQLAASSVAREERLAQELSASFAELKEARAQISTLTSNYEHLKQEVAQERESHASSRHQMIDKHERLRTRVLRRLRTDATFLSDGLHALRNNHEKIAEEFIDRTLTSLNQELTLLEDRDSLQ